MDYRKKKMIFYHPNIKHTLDFAKHSSHIEGNVDLINGKDINRNCWFGCLAFIAADGSTNYAYEQTKKKYDIIFTPHKQEKYMMFYEAGDMHDDWFVHFYDIVPADVKKDIEEKRCLLIVSMMNEGINMPSTFPTMHEFIDRVGASKDTFMFISADFNIENKYKKFCEENPNIEPVDVIKSQYFVTAMTNEYEQMSRVPQDYVNRSMGSFSQVNMDIRDYHYVCMNRLPKIHRQVIIAYLLKLGIFDKGLVSLLDGGVDNFETFQGNRYSERPPIYRGKEKEDIMPYWEKTKDMAPMTIDIDYETLKNNFGAWNTHMTFEPHNNSYFSIQTGTSYDTDWIHLDDKFFKCFGLLQPFIWVGPPNTLPYAEKYGFKTFHPYIDESYDKIEDPQDRMLAIVKEIERLCSMSKKEIHEWYHSMWNILAHNLEVVKTPFDCYEKIYSKVYDKFTYL